MCKHTKRAITAHVITLLALYNMYFEAVAKDNQQMFDEEMGESLEAVHCLNIACQSGDEKNIQECHSVLVRSLDKVNVQTFLSGFDESRANNYQFKAMRVYMRMVERLLLFIHASRERDWILHLAAAEDLIKDLVSMDRIHYRRLMPVYIANMRRLEEEDPAIWEALANGQFSVSKSSVPFTSIGVDYAGEQVNRVLKVDGGLTGISSNQNARTRLLLIAPIISHLTEEMKARSCSQEKVKTHHQLTPSFLSTQRKKIERLQPILSDNSYLFADEDDKSIYNIITKAVVPDRFFPDIVLCESIGERCYEMFVEERMKPESTVSIWDPLKKLKLGTFSSMNKRIQSKVGSKVVEIKQSRGLLGRIALVSKSNRDFDLQEMIGSFELQVIPPSLMVSDGSLHPGHEGKSQLLQGLEQLAKTREDTEASVILRSSPTKNIVIIDRMVIVQKLAPKPSWVRTGSDLAKYFLQKIYYLAEHAHEIRLVFDTYNENSLKKATRSRRRGDQASTLYRVEDNTNIQHVSMSKFLSNDVTKQNLTIYLAERAVAHFSSFQELSYLVSANGSMVGNIPWPNHNNHEKADTLLVWHAIHASTYNPDATSEIFVMSPDTDVLVIMISFAEQLLENTYFTMSTERKIRVASAYKELGSSKSKALIAFHALTGCDTTGKFFGNGKGQWFKNFQKADKAVVEQIATVGMQTPLEEMIELERFVAKVYCPKSKSISTLSEARWHLFCRRPDDCEKLPPSSAAFAQHVLRAHFQAAIWYGADTSHQLVMDPGEYGWALSNNGYSPISFKTNVAPNAVIEMTSCNCKQQCKTNRCSCKRQNMPCADMRRCEECENMSMELEELEDSDEDMEEREQQ